MAAIVISPVLRSAVNRVWNNIGHDILAAGEECGESTTNLEAVESCLDADRLKYEGLTEADNEYRALIKEHGYTKVLKAIAAVCSLN